MPNQSAVLDSIFQGLADPTRRALLARLAAGSAPVSELARPFPMALPSLMQHLSVLESAGLVRSKKTGRVRTYRLAPQRMRVAERWLGTQRAAWETRLDQLDHYLLTLKDQNQ